MPFLLLAALLATDFRLALPGYRYSFPRDHFEHPEFRTEWWYYTGNVRAEDGRRFGFELVFFRQAQRRGPSENASAWRIDDLYLAHLALTDIGAQRFRYHQRLNRAGPGVAGASFERAARVERQLVGRSGTAKNRPCGRWPRTYASRSSSRR